MAQATLAPVLAGTVDAEVIAGSQAGVPPVLNSELERSLYEHVVPTVPPAPHVRVDHTLADGDTLDWAAPADVLHVPGHTPGGIAIHCPAWRLLFVGDIITTAAGPPVLGPFNVELDQAVASFRLLAQLDVDVVCLGHGEPLLGDAGAKLRAIPNPEAWLLA